VQGLELKLQYHRKENQTVKRKKEEMLPNSFHKANMTPIPQLSKDATKNSQ
jgi:hypothetical protein